MAIAESPQSAVEALTTCQYRNDLARAASASLAASAAQLREYAGNRHRPRPLLDVLGADLLSVALWLDERAALLEVDP